MVLRDLEIGESCIVEHVGGEGSLRQHLTGVLLRQVHLTMKWKLLISPLS